ncbi:MAG: hypothetical protein IPP19_10445 [Verrucomicrobia bacterium]|nr:hypothetical protein [Verrucomicrobiota bacterium]
MNTLNRFILTFTILTCAALGRAATAPVFEWSVYKQADYPANGMNIIITAEGYTASQKAQFISDAQTTIEGMLQVEPWKSYASHINFYTSWVVSNQSGISTINGSVVTKVDTAFKAVYNEMVREDGGWDSGIMAAYQKAVPVQGHHLLLVNAPTNGFGLSESNSGGASVTTAAGVTTFCLSNPQFESRKVPFMSSATQWVDWPTNISL